MNNSYDPTGPEPYCRVRFHLSSGPNYKHWQVSVIQGREKIGVYYYNPNEYQLELIGCKLVNKLNKAKKVHAEGVKDVSGWVRCSDVVLRKDTYPVLPVDNLEKLYYNPILDPRWRRDSDDGEFEWDDTEYDTLITSGKQVYILEERT